MASESNVVIGGGQAGGGGGHAHARPGVGGQAGGRAIQAMRRVGFAGEIVLIGDEKHLPYERPPLSKDFLLKGSAAKMPTVLDQAWADENKVSLRLGVAAIGIDRQARKIAL